MEIVLGMEVMVTFNVSTDLDVANVARGHEVDIALDPPTHMINLQYPPIYILVRMIHTKADALEGLESGVLPITPLTKTFSVITASSNKVTVTSTDYTCVCLH